MAWAPTWQLRQPHPDKRHERRQYLTSSRMGWLTLRTLRDICSKGSCPTSMISGHARRLVQAPSAEDARPGHHRRDLLPQRHAAHTN